MSAYQSIHPDAAQDIARHQEWEEKWMPGLSESEREAQRRQAEGEQLEMLAHAVFAKHLGPDFVVVRAADHDDRVNKADTLLLERATGNLVCAFDEVGDTWGVDYEKKRQAVQDRNLKQGGVSLKYGLGLEQRDGKTVVIGTEEKNVPVFYLALPSDRISKGMKEFNPDPAQTSDFEKKLFEYFLGALDLQAKGLDLYEKRLPADLLTKLHTFKNILDTLNSKRSKRK